MKNFIDTLSTHFLICQEMIEGKGEDSGFEEFNELGGIHVYVMDVVDLEHYPTQWRKIRQERIWHPELLEEL